MSPEVHALHARRFERMLTDLDIDPAGMIADSETALTVAFGRRLSPALGNQTLAEGLCSAVKLAGAAMRGELP